MKRPLETAPRAGGWVGLMGLLLIATGIGSVAAQEQLLSAEEAFQPAAEAVGPERVRITWEVAEGYYLFRDMLELKVVEPSGARVTTTETPAGGSMYDPRSRKQRQVYRGEARLTAELAGIKDADEVTVTVRYQGSADALKAGICLPVQSTEFDIALP